MDSGGEYTSAPERGARRRKLAGYLKTANELRQSYQQAYGLGAQKDGVSDDGGLAMPGTFPGATVVQSGDEEMLLFPSYATRHGIRKNRHREVPGASQGIRSDKGTGDAEYWKRQWDRYEDENSVVDVDVRGWIYAPHRGQMTRKNRLLVGIARQLSGIPAPSSSRAASPKSLHHDRAEARKTRHEEELVEKEAESITRKGQGEADIASWGGYSEPSGCDEDESMSLDHSRPSSAEKGASQGGDMPRPVTNSSLRYEHDEPGMISPSKRRTWTQPSEMTSAELSVANAHLMVRLKPFLTTPLASTTLTVFFYDDQNSRSRTIMTNDAGHFSLRAALDFIPTHVRVLASDKLSATEGVRITEPSGVSMISDIDDTIKHSGISNGAREIFRNAFIRDLGDLTIDGVREWYTTMADLGVDFHYVSNSPWQLYPVLVSFFAQAGLPKGSFHLKQYTGMLQGIFEPVAERKKGTIERIVADFPGRRFILAGDSGEADLEVYTDIMLANPGRILGVFIRDVTMGKPPGFFDSSVVRSRSSPSPLRGRSKANGSVSPKRRSTKLEEKPPALPPRQISQSASTLTTEDSGPTMGTLIDVDDGPTPSIHHSMTDPVVDEATRKLSSTSIKSLPQSRPSKPTSLRSTSGAHKQSQPASITRKPAPAPPPKPRQYSTSQDSTNKPGEPSPLSQTETATPPGSSATPLERQSYRSAVRNKVTSSYNALPSLHNPPTQPPNQPPHTSDPAIPSRRTISSYPAAAAQYAGNRLSGGWTGYTNDAGSSSSDDPNGNNYNGPVLSRKEELWMRRWARAKEVFEDNGVVLRAWRVGEDVAHEAVRLVERARKEEKR